MEISIHEFFQHLLQRHWLLWNGLVWCHAMLLLPGAPLISIGLQCVGQVILRLFAAWLCGWTLESRGTWPDLPVPYYLCVFLQNQFSAEHQLCGSSNKMWKPSWDFCYPQRMEETSKTPGGSEEQTFIMRFNLFPLESTHNDTADLTILRAKFFREVGLGCPEHLGHLHLGARVSEAIVSNAIYVPLWNKIIGETILDKRRCLCFGKCQEKPEQLFEMDPPWCRRYLPNNARIWDTIYKW